jgi:hypothetical protein
MAMITPTLSVMMAAVCVKAAAVRVSGKDNDRGENDARENPNYQ